MEAADNHSSEDIVRGLYRAFASRDERAIRAVMAEDIVWHRSPGFPDGGTLHGTDAVLAGIVGSFDAEWIGWRFNPERFIEAGETVIVLGYYGAENRKTGRSMRAETAHVFDIANGLVKAFRQYSDSHTIQLART